LVGLVSKEIKNEELKQKHKLAFKNNQIYIWDLHKEKILKEIEMKENVVSIKFHTKLYPTIKIRLIIITDIKIYFYSNKFELYEEIDTIENENGLCSISNDINNLVCVFPIANKGYFIIIKKNGWN
jgi:hypothetical protein